MTRHAQFLISRNAALVVAAISIGFPTPVPGKDQTYTVRKNDTISGIARAYGVSATRLAQCNALNDPDTIYVGQRLRVPSKGPGAVPTAFNPAVRNLLADVDVRPGRWQWIVIHHSATDEGNARDIDRYHREQRHMNHGLAYHFVIGNGHGMRDGNIAVGHRWREQLHGGHVASEALNATSIGICLIGNFEHSRPTQPQMDSLEALTQYLLARCDLNSGAVETHRQIGCTRCPGRYFPTQTFRERLDGFRDQSHRQRATSRLH